MIFLKDRDWRLHDGYIMYTAGLAAWIKERYAQLKFT